jgi:CRISPR-associated protein Csm4
MRQAVILRCSPESRFHFGRPSLDVDSGLHDTSEWIHSDTLFSALINIAAQFSDQPDLDAIFDLFDSGKVKMSSGFFCIANDEAPQGERYLYFLPKPEHYILHEAVDFKAVGAIKFISKGLWERGIHPGNKDWRTKNTDTIQHKFKITREESEWLKHGKNRIEEIYSVLTTPRVDARQPGEENGFFFLSYLVLHRLPQPYSVHFYFLMDIEEEIINTPAFSMLKTAIEMLPDCGIGGERTGGCGLFESIHLEDFDLSEFPSGDNATLSLALPSSAEELQAFKQYKTMLRGGRQTATDDRLHQVRMIVEGACMDGSANGCIVDIGKQGVADIPYWRNGKVFSIPVHQNTMLV